MQKRKVQKTSKASKFNPESHEPDFFDNMMDDMAMSHIADTVIGEIMPCVINSSVEVMKLVVENRARNKEKMDDNDIYNIFKESFSSVTSGIKLHTPDDD